MSLNPYILSRGSYRISGRVCESLLSLLQSFGFWTCSVLDYPLLPWPAPSSHGLLPPWYSCTNQSSSFNIFVLYRPGMMFVDVGTMVGIVRSFMNNVCILVEDSCILVEDSCILVEDSCASHSPDFHRTVGSVTGRFISFKIANFLIELFFKCNFKI